MSDQPKKPEAVDKADKPAEPKKDKSLGRDELDKVSGGRAPVFVQGGPVFSQVQSYRKEIQGDASEPKRSVTEIFDEVSAE